LHKKNITIDCAVSLCFAKQGFSSCADRFTFIKQRIICNAESSALKMGKPLLKKEGFLFQEKLFAKELC
jgi:hypothetical protein